AVQVLALERVSDDGLVLDADEVGEAAVAQRPHRALELPWRRVGARERVVPGDVVLEDRLRAGRERLLHVGEVVKPRDVVEDGLGADAEDGNLGAGHEAPTLPLSSGSGRS